jgi:hypothetical protein
VAFIKEHAECTQLPAGNDGRQLIKKHESDCPECGLGAPNDSHHMSVVRTAGRQKKKKLPIRKVVAMPKTKVVEKPKTKGVEIIEVISVIKEGKVVLGAIALENKLAQCQDKECELRNVAVVVVPLHVMGPSMHLPYRVAMKLWRRT